MSKQKNENPDRMTDEELLAAVRQKPHPGALRETIFEISRKMAMSSDNREDKGISWAEEI